MIINTVREFLRLESASGILLVVAAVLAMAIENSPAKPFYDALLGTPVLVQVGEFGIGKPLLLWINDGLMAVFFLLVGLELKRELVRGELSDPSRVVLPVIAAVGGMAIPAAVYLSLNIGDPVATRGWAIPAATDIAFALGVLSLLGSRVPHQLKLFLLTLAIVDDLGAIIIIALFYTSELSLASLGVAAGVLVGLWVLNRRNVLSITAYLLLGAILWVAVLKSGVHATLAGVLVALFIPVKVKKKDEESPLEQLEHDLHPTVAFIILPIFAFANTGVSLAGLSIGSLLAPVPLGIAAGLFIGKQVGVFGFVWLAVKLGIGRLPEQISWAGLYGMSALCGIGFTMSLFISSLAFEQGGDMALAVDDRLGILMGSLLSAVVGYLLLRFALKHRAAQPS